MKNFEKAELEKRHTKFCPRCHDYQVGIWKQCPNCRTPLMSVWIVEAARILRRLAVMAGLGLVLVLGTYGIQVRERDQYQEGLRLLQAGRWDDGAGILRQALSVNPVYTGLKGAARETAGILRNKLTRMKEKLAEKPKSGQAPAKQVPTVKRKIVW